MTIIKKLEGINDLFREVEKILTDHQIPVLALPGYNIKIVPLYRKPGCKPGFRSC